MITVLEAIQSLDAGAKVIIGGEGTDNIRWMENTTVIPIVEIEAEIVRLQAEYDANQYQRDRASAFPSTGDQLDMQYWDQVNGTTTWKDAVAKVKSDNPKP